MIAARTLPQGTPTPRAVDRLGRGRLGRRRTAGPERAEEPEVAPALAVGVLVQMIVLVECGGA